MRPTLRSVRHAGTLGLGIVLSACVSGDRERAEPTVSGILTYPGAFPLPPDPRVAVALLDVTGDDIPTVLLAETTAVRNGDLTFALRYNPALIDPSHAYAVAARILGADGQVYFVSAGDYRVLTGGYPSRTEVPLLPAGVTGPLPERAAAVAARLRSLERVDGSWQDGDAGSTISAYFDGPALRYLEERMTIGAYGSAANAYYFDEGALFFIESLRNLAAGTPAGGDLREEIALRVLYAPDGNRQEATRWVNGVVTELDEAELRSTLRHADGLREAALQLAARR